MIYFLPTAYRKHNYTNFLICISKSPKSDEFNTNFLDCGVSFVVTLIFLPIRKKLFLRYEINFMDTLGTPIY